MSFEHLQLRHTHNIILHLFPTNVYNHEYDILSYFVLQREMYIDSIHFIIAGQQFSIFHEMSGKKSIFRRHTPQ